MNATGSRASAAAIVFRLPELLEAILLNLPQRELLLSQRVCTSFRDTVRSSVKLQKALFFVPDWKLKARALNAYAATSKPGRRPENNRLLLRAFPGCYPTITLVITNSDADMIEDTALSKRRGSEEWSWDVCISFPAETMPCCDPSVLYPEASWRRMYLSQPPCVDLHLVRRYQRSIHPAMVRPAGITMGEFVHEATKTQLKWHRSYISSDRDWHFEGNIKSNSIDDQLDISSPELVLSYVYSRSRRDGAVRALSDEWDPGHASAFARATAQDDR